MLIELAVGSAIMVVTILIAGASMWFMEYLMLRAGPWLARPPHRVKLMLVLFVASLWALWIVTEGVWIWALTLWGLGIFIHLESSVYFTVVAFTTLGFGDILLPPQWRLLGGMAATNGLLSFGMLTAVMIEALRQVRVRQLEERNRHRPD